MVVEDWSVTPSLVQAILGPEVGRRLAGCARSSPPPPVEPRRRSRFTHRIHLSPGVSRNIERVSMSSCSLSSQDCFSYRPMILTPFVVNHEADCGRDPSLFLTLGRLR